MGVLVAVAAVVGAFVGLVINLIFMDVIPPMPRTEAVLAYPLPHHASKYAGGVSLRFAMVHDVLHERYARHGEDYYRERNRRVREMLGKIETEQGPSPASDEYFALYDDLGAGLDALKEDDEAVRILRDKLRRQETLDQSGRQLYTSYANLGTFLVHGNFQKAVAGDSAAREHVREGLQYIGKSMAVNPEAHFGREIWQERAGDFLLGAIDQPESLLKFDLVGDQLPEEIEPSERRCIRKGEMFTSTGFNRELLHFLREEPYLSGARREDFREYIATVGIPPVPFDEPTLGIIGMWRLGGGANPHFALALGEIMVRVGQRHIAWCAYERATQLADRFWPDAGIQGKFVEHCRKRQAIIERQLTVEDRDQLRPRFEAELAYGRRYQESYQAYEAKRIGEGASLDDEHFYDAFLAEHEPIASPVGDEDYIFVKAAPGRGPNLPAIVLFGGLFAFVTACLLRLVASWTRNAALEENVSRSFPA